MVLTSTKTNHISEDIDMNKEVEYRVRPVTRYIITRYHSEQMPNGLYHAGCETIGSFDNQTQAEQVANALSKAEPRSVYQSGIPGSDGDWSVE